MKNIAIIILAGCIVWGGTVLNGFVWDDTPQITTNAMVHSLTNIPKLFASSTFGTPETSLKYYRPLMSLAFTFLYAIAGNVPAVFHLASAALHIGSAILLYILFKRYFRQATSLLLSLVFLVHPMQVEAVGYVSSLMELLFFFFGMVALLTSSRVVLAICLLLSLLSKETGILFVPMILILNRKSIRSLILPIFLALVVYLLLRVGVAGFYLSESGETAIFQVPLAERLLTIPKVIFYYLFTFLFPLRLAILQEWTVKMISFSNFWLPLAAVLCGSSILAFYAVKSRSPMFGFFMIWFLIGMGLHAQFFPLDMTVADRWFYFSMVGILGMIGIFLNNIKKIWITVIIIVLLSLRTIIRIPDWKDNLTLYRKDVSVTSSANLEFNLAVTLLESRNIQEASVHLANAISLSPSAHLKAYYEAIQAGIEGNQTLAREKYLESIRLGEYPLAYANLSTLLYEVDTWDHAMAFIESSLPKQPKNGQLWLNLALLEYEHGNRDKALEAATKAYTLSPTTDGLYVLTQIKNGERIYD